MRTWPVRAILQSRRARNTSVTFSCNPCKTARDDGYKSRVCTPQSSESHHPKEVICHSPKTPERSSSVDEPASAGEVAQLRRELAHGLGVVTHNLQVVQDTIKPELAYTLATGGRKKNNLKVGKANFSVPIGRELLSVEDTAGRPKFFCVRPDDDGGDDEPSSLVSFVDSLLDFGGIEVCSAHTPPPHAPHATTRRHAPCAAAAAAAHAAARTRRRPRRPHSPDARAHRVCVRAQRDDLQIGLIAFAAYISGQIASVKPRKRGHKQYLNMEVQGLFEDHDQWNEGIKRALKFFTDRVACPTDDLIILAYRNSMAKRKRSE